MDIEDFAGADFFAVFGDYDQGLSFAHETMRVKALTLYFLFIDSRAVKCRITLKSL